MRLACIELAYLLIAIVALVYLGLASLGWV